ncbi:metallophosphoesterase [Psychromarinibacter sp. C21-152]|uniref:Metallophosphoesterase n=1 Tax=Psychromarinibacter sediminicola TaxID=3033385 RepID=A0AAE3NNW9_9RHOB|nr:metallophosphoesterase [Psychromarinibacter sediminicola]MDF0599411.1 metallophosphoesterase [Psychromarinibacter sediminicola]
MSILRRFLGSGRKAEPAARPAPLPQPKPAEPFYVIGDVHGCADLLRPLVEQLEEVDAEAPLIFVGDLVDRGEQSRQTLEYLLDLADRRRGPLVCLAGNHEDMLLRFLDDPEEAGRRWLRYGGLQTVASFGLAIPDRNERARHTKLRDALAEAMGPKMIDWLRELPHYWMSGNVAVTHAGADPLRPIDDQPKKNLTWGHPDFETVPRVDEVWVIHGHTIVDAPVLTNGRICVDTGAYATGRLTAASISADGVRFYST